MGRNITRSFPRYPGASFPFFFPNIDYSLSSRGKLYFLFSLTSCSLQCAADAFIWDKGRPYNPASFIGLNWNFVHQHKSMTYTSNFQPTPDTRMQLKVPLSVILISRFPILPENWSGKHEDEDLIEQNGKLFWAPRRGGMNLEYRWRAVFRCDTIY